MFFSKKQSIVGVDIGTSYIKIAQITHGDRKVLNTYGIVNVETQIDSRNTATGVRDTAAVLRNLMTQARVNTKRCVASLPNSAVFTSVIDMPNLSTQELNSAMEFEAKKYVPLPFSEVALSWSVIGKDDTNNSSKVLLIAVPKQVRENYIKVFELAGLQLEIIEIEALALIRALVVDASKNSVIIDIGAKATGVNIVKNGLLQLTRNLNVGGDTITDRIAQTLNITAERAEQFKKDFGISESDFTPEAIRPVLSLIKNEIRQLFTIYQSHGVNIDNILLVGGGAQLPGILEYFKDLSATVIRGSPLHDLIYSDSAGPLLARYSSQLPVAIGLALRHE